MSVAGAGFSFSAWSTQLKAQLDFSQPEVEQVAFMGNMGSYIGLVWI